MARRRHKRQEKMTGQEKRDLIQKLKAMGFKGKDLRQVLDVDQSMRENLESFKEALRQVVKRKSSS